MILDEISIFFKTQQGFSLYVHIKSFCFQLLLSFNKQKILGRLIQLRTKSNQLLIASNLERPQIKQSNKINCLIYFEVHEETEMMNELLIDMMELDNPINRKQQL
ncbi:unnamed protein product (macronuclear) [Paramecium tetraurelia]|uniref:Uncharacterized protein n=1 Tax=Paramecium tetraurelia TaxID=5888 RepID=A0BDC1_PARTE|nr:uncharacterized protein GSPATT00027566001 [Paramecium tetraurelia]CAK56538.1 unnamed protein product [Paramecium tetraurelia]|eukprot:XP_001423936.1 hypothetical protein (macronuclear) [Paramecium tetraurelia strain d4-2]